MSTLVAQTISNGTVSTSSANVIQGSARAWVNFTGSNGVVRSSYNVSSVTRNNTGNYWVNLTNAMPNVNYITHLNHGAYGSAAFRGWDIIFNQETTRTRVETRNEAGDEVDAPLVCVSVFG